MAATLSPAFVHWADANKVLQRRRQAQVRSMHLVLENLRKVHKTRNPYIKDSEKKRVLKYQLSVLLVIQFG